MVGTGGAGGGMGGVGAVGLGVNNCVMPPMHCCNAWNCAARSMPTVGIHWLVDVLRELQNNKRNGICSNRRKS